MEIKRVNWGISVSFIKNIGKTMLNQSADDEMGKSAFSLFVI